MTSTERGNAGIRTDILVSKLMRKSYTLGLMLA
jgi:hypothetical protein